MEKIKMTIIVDIDGYSLNGFPSIGDDIGKLDNLVLSRYDSAIAEVISIENIEILK